MRWRSGRSDVALYMVKKGLCYLQTDAFQPSADATNGFPFQADVYPAVQGMVTNAFVKVANSNGFTQLALTSSETHYQFKKSKNTLKTLNKSYPDGNYLLAMYGTDDGEVSASLPLQGDAYPLTPYITNFTLLQSVNPNGYCVVGWEGYGSGAATDFIRLTLEDSAGNQYFQSPNVGKQGAWSGLTSYGVVGPGNLATGQTYTVTLDFQKNTTVNLSSYPGSLGVAGYFTETKLSLVTSMAAAPDVKAVEVSKSKLLDTGQQRFASLEPVQPLRTQGHRQGVSGRHAHQRHSPSARNGQRRPGPKPWRSNRTTDH